MTINAPPTGVGATEPASAPRIAIAVPTNIAHSMGSTGIAANPKKRNVKPVIRTTNVCRTTARRQFRANV